MDELAEERAQRTIGAAGSKIQCPAGAKGVAVGQIRRALSVVAVRAQARLLLDRLWCVGKGAVEHERRRKADMRQEELMEAKSMRECVVARGLLGGAKRGAFSSR